MPTTRLVLKASIRWAGKVGWLLLFSTATGCVGPGQPSPDPAVERILAPGVVSGQPGTAAQEPAPGVGGWTVVQAEEGHRGEHKSTPEREQNTLPPPKKPGFA